MSPTNSSTQNPTLPRIPRIWIFQWSNSGAMDQIHLDHLGKSAKVVLKRLPPSQPEPPVVEKTSLGAVVPLKVINGVNAALDPTTLPPATLIECDPQLALDPAAQLLDPYSLSTAY